MGSPKGSGYIETRRRGRERLYRARRQVAGRRIVGPWRRSFAQAQQDRLSLAPSGPVDRTLSLSEFVRYCIDHRYRRKGKETVETHRSVWRCHIDGSPLGSTPIEAVTRRRFQDYVDSHDGSAQLVRKVGSVVSVALAEAVRMGVLDENPCRGARYPRIKRRRNVVLQEAEFELFADPADLLESMMVVSLHTLLRRSEVCGLQWSEVVGETILKESDKSDDARAVPMTPQVSRIVRSQPRRSRFVFTRQDGSPPDPDWYTAQWKRWRDRHGIDPRVRLHDLRGSSVTLLLAKGYDLPTVQSLARHRDSRTTLDIYAQVVGANKTAAVSALQKHTSKAHPEPGRGRKRA